MPAVKRWNGSTWEIISGTASASGEAPSNMVTTDSYQEITGPKDWVSHQNFNAGIDVVTTANFIDDVVVLGTLVAEGVYDGNSNRVYSPNNPPPASTPSNMVTTNTAQTISGHKTITGNIYAPNALFDSSDASARVYSPNYPPPASGPTVTTLEYTGDTSGALGSFAGPHVVLVSAASVANYTLTLPVAVQGRQVTIKKTDATTNTLTIAGGGRLIDGASTAVMRVQYESITVVSDGINWFII
jgi:hypothetical protein